MRARSGAGHFVKMIHNGIEYGLMQAYAEGFDILQQRRHGEAARGACASTSTSPRSPRSGGAAAWSRRGCSTSRPRRSRRTRSSSSYSGHVEDSGEGRWTVQAAIEEAVPADVLTAALYTRFRSRQEHTFAEKMLSAMRHGFGGHVEPPKKS